MGRQEDIDIINILNEQSRREKLILYKTVYENLYNWQEEFVAATKDHHECCLIAANQIGKTWLGTDIDAMHLLGDYPQNWSGYRFNFAPMCWGLGYSMEKTRDLLQTALFGNFSNGKFDGGLVPIDRIINWESATGTPNSMRTVRVRHSSGQASTFQMWSYSQGQHAIMGDVVDWFHIDEEPKDEKIRPQVLTRTINGDKGRGGRGIYTFTPENGRTELVTQFMDKASVDQFFMMKGWSDAPHMTSEKMERLLAQYPAHQRDMRSKGVPMLGHGRIYDLDESMLEVDAFEIPIYWKVINGMDFGWDHPQAHMQLVQDPDSDIIYITHSWKQSEVSANEAWGAVKDWAKNVPTAWPHDGLQHEKGRDDSMQQKEHYAKAGFKMLKDHATWKTGGLSVESGIYEILDLMRKGKFRIFKGQIDLVSELRVYHRDEKGKIVKKNDDILDAIRYAYMMLRKAKRVGELINSRQPQVKKAIKARLR